MYQFYFKGMTVPDMSNFMKMALLHQSCMELTSGCNKSEIYLKYNGRKCFDANGKRKAL